MNRFVREVAFLWFIFMAFDLAQLFLTGSTWIGDMNVWKASWWFTLGLMNLAMAVAINAVVYTAFKALGAVFS